MNRVKFNEIKNKDMIISLNGINFNLKFHMASSIEQDIEKSILNLDKKEDSNVKH